MNREVLVPMDPRHFEALQQLAVRLHMTPEEVMLQSLRIHNSLIKRRGGIPTETLEDLPAESSQDLVVAVGQTTPFSSKDEYLEFQASRVFRYIKEHVEVLDPAGVRWVDEFERRLKEPEFRITLSPAWMRLPLSMDRRLTLLDDRLVQRGAPGGFARLMRPYTDPRVMPWVSECGETIVKFVEAYICGYLPGQTPRVTVTAMGSMIQDLWAQALCPTTATSAA